MNRSNLSSLPSRCVQTSSTYVVTIENKHDQLSRRGSVHVYHVIPPGPLELPDAQSPSIRITTDYHPIYLEYNLAQTAGDDDRLTKR